MEIFSGAGFARFWLRLVDYVTRYSKGLDLGNAGSPTGIMKKPRLAAGFLG